MASLEIDSFVLKFKNLWRAGRNASLTIKANAGKAHVNLSVELDHHADRDHPQHVKLLQGSRNGPARQRRRLKRAAAREAALAEKAVAEHDDAVKAIVDRKAIVNPNFAVEAKADKSTATVIETETIHQLDESGKKMEKPTYCKLCKECWPEMETAEDLSYHMMNNHEPQEVFENYGQRWIEERKHCVRKMSPFTSWFSTPPIS